MESVNVSNAFEIHMQELKMFQEKHPKAFKVKPAISFVLPESSFSLLLSKERKELSTIYFSLAKAIIENGIMLEDKRIQALNYLNTSTSLDAMCNKEAYIMVANIYATNGNPIGACVNFLIAMTLSEILRKDEKDESVFIQQCKKMPFPIPQNIRRHNMNEGVSIDLLLVKDIVLILEPGTYILTMPIMGDNIVIIGIGEVTINNNVFSINCRLVLYNIRVECIGGHSLVSKTSHVYVENCQFTKCSDTAAPIFVDNKGTLFMNKCIIANSKNSGGILIDIDSKAIITNCEIYNIRVSAIEVRYGSSLHAENNDIHHSKQGVIAWLDANEVMLINNVIHDNEAEGVLVSGNREPALSKKINIQDKLRESIYAPPPDLSYTKPSQTVVVLKKNRLLKNGFFGVSVDYQANVRMVENEIATSGKSGCIIKGGVDASLSNNNIHHNKVHGIEIGINYNGKVVIENNRIHSNKVENISQLSEKFDLPKIYKTNKVTRPIKMINNKLGDDDLYEHQFVDFNVPSNRPGMHLFYEEEPSLYAIGNTYGFNLLNKLDIGAVISDKSHLTSTTFCDTRKIENKQVSVFLGGIGDLRNIVETVHGLTKSLESHTNNYINLIFTINDFNPTVLTRDLVLLEMISRLPDPKPQYFTNREGLYSKWNKDFIIGVTQVLSVWAEKVIDTDTYQILFNCIHSLMESFENAVDKVTNKNYIAGSSKKLPSWISFNYSTTASSILQTLRYWQENTTTAAVINWDTVSLETIKTNMDFIPEIELLDNLKKFYCVDEDIDKYTLCQLPISFNAQFYDEKHDIDYPNRNVNVTMLTVPTMEDNIYPTSCIFRAFQVDTDLSQFRDSDQPLTLYDHLLSTLLPKLMSLRATLCKDSSVQMQVIPILGDVIDTLLCRLPSSVKFNTIDCSNLADYESLLNILLAAAPRLKNNSQFTSQLMKLRSQPSKSMNEFVEERLGVGLSALERLTGITYVNAYYKDFAVYVTWNFDITYKTGDIEKNLDILMTDVISVAAICCDIYIIRIKGLSINILVRLFQIMIFRFSKEIITQLLQSLFASEGFKKHIPNFAMHLVELKAFMTLHLPWSMLSKLEEFKESKPSIARYTVKWITDKEKIEKVKIHSTKWITKKNKNILHSEAGIWLRLIKPTFFSGDGKTRKKKKKGKDRSYNTSNDQEPAYYYFNSVSLSVTESPLVIVSFHLPVSFYNTHKAWILECNIGSVMILSTAKKLTLSEATQNLNNDIWIDASTTEDSNKIEDNKETDENVKTCKHCGKTSDLKCSKCKLVYYCSRDCQKKDWKRHKMEDCIGHEVTQKNLHHDTR